MTISLDVAILRHRPVLLSHLRRRPDLGAAICVSSRVSINRHVKVNDLQAKDVADKVVELAV
jgi:hypothetical protein